VSPTQIRPASLQPAAAVEYYAGLLEDRPETPAFPKVQIGSVTWIRPGPNAGGSSAAPAPEAAMPVAKVAIAPAGIVAEIAICCRAGEGAPPSELSLAIRLAAQPPQDPIRGVGGPQMRLTGNVQGEILASAVTPGPADTYRVLLSRTPEDLDRNLRLLLGRPWIDIPVVFASGRRAILTFTTGRVGADIIDQALHAWH
jgi:hypothetical protein